jgi:hypothetical protein
MRTTRIRSITKNTAGVEKSAVIKEVKAEREKGEFN